MIHQPEKNCSAQTAGKGQKVRGGRSRPSCKNTAMMCEVFVFSSRRKTDQHSSHHGGHGVPPLPPVDALALWPAEVIQEASHDCLPQSLSNLLALPPRCRRTSYRHLPALTACRLQPVDQIGCLRNMWLLRVELEPH